MKYFLFIVILPFITMMPIDKTSQVNQSIEKEISGLHHLVREQKDTTKEAPVLILLHGYGSNENDLFSFENRMPEHWLIVSVRAPIDLGRNRFKWYNVKLVNEKIIASPSEEKKSRKLLLELIDEIVLKYNVDKNKIVTAGFSQGAGIALSLALTEPEKILAAGCFSGHFMEEIKPLIKKKKILKSREVFISHGTEDSMLPLRYMEENKAILEKLGIKVKLSIDKIGHSISNRQLNEFVEWITSL